MNETTPQTCPNCNKGNRWYARFCAYCAADLTGEVAEPRLGTGPGWVDAPAWLPVAPEEYED